MADEPNADHSDAESAAERPASTDEYHAFWADEVADEILARDPLDPIVIKGAVSPSGVPHIGHFNEIMRGYYVAEVLRDRGRTVRQVFTSDDRDALRKLPRRLADADWNLVELGDVDAGALGRNLGVPYTDVPDPFGDNHDSYGDHFTALLVESAELAGVPVEFFSVTDLYTAGAFDDLVERVLADRDRARAVLSAFQAGVDEAYVPFMPQCAACGKLTTNVTAVDVTAGTVSYTCTGLEAGGQEIEGCGHEGTATFREGKLPWRFEWPADWAVFGVDFEPFGKDHAEGSWPSGQEIAREILDVEPPVPMTYEWFTLNGEALSSSAGNVVTIPEVLEFVEPEVLRYFFAKSPRKQRDLDLSRIDRLVDEFDRIEALYFGDVEDADRGAFADRAYPMVMDADAVLPADYRSLVDADPDDRAVATPEPLVPGVNPTLAGDPVSEPARRTRRRFLDDVFPARVRLPYTFAAVLGMTDDRDLRVEMARREGHLSAETPEWAVEKALDRVERARRWAERMDNEYNYRLQTELPTVSVDDATEAALADLAAVVESGADGDAIQGRIYEIAREHDLDVGDFFATGYRLFLGQSDGPRLGPFLGALDRRFVAQRLRREG